jgi:CRISPR-associated protein Cas2
MKSGFKMGWLIICFDLPVTDAECRKKASKFRKDLLEMGCFMLQNSVYLRNCVSYEKVNKYIEQIKSIAPIIGKINIITITDKQWEKSINIELTEYVNSKKVCNSSITQPHQMTFW